MFQHSELGKPPLFFLSKSWLVGLGIATLLSTGGVYFVRFQPLADRSVPVTPASSPVITKVTALGRLEPDEEVINISGPVGGGRVSQLLIKEGDRVEAEEVIAILDNRDRLQATLAEAEEQVRLAEARLAQVKAGAKQGQISAREATINRLQAEREGEIKTQEAEIARLEAQLSGEIATQQATTARLEAEFQGQRQALQATVERIEAERRNAQTDVERYESLYTEGVISSQELDRKRLLAETTTQELLETEATQTRTLATLQQQIAEANAIREKTLTTLNHQIEEAKAQLEKTIATLTEQIEEAKADLEQTAEVRPTDVATAQAEVDSAIATVTRIEKELDLAYIRAPKTGKILKIHARDGESIEQAGIAELGQTDQMYVVAEVYETDIGKVKVGQAATVTSAAVDEQLQGKVDQIGLQVRSQDVLDTNPTANTDARVIEVKIRLDAISSEKVGSLTNQKVRVNIEI